MIKLTPNIFLVPGPREARFPYCNCLLIKDDIKILIDTSCGNENLKKLQQERPDIIINTHFHEDHILNNYKFPSSEIWAHTLDAPAIRSLQEFKNYYGFSKFNADKVGEDFIIDLDLHSSPVHHELVDQEKISVGKNSVWVIHTPGHTPGHCSFYFEETGILYSSDIDLSSFGPWYGHLCSNIDDFIESINKIMVMEPNIIISAHKGIINENIKQRLINYRDKIYFREDLIINALKQPYSFENLAALSLYYGAGVKSTPFIEFQEKAAIWNHLQRLLKQGVILQDGAIYFKE